MFIKAYKSRLDWKRLRALIINPRMGGPLLLLWRLWFLPKMPLLPWLMPLLVLDNSDWAGRRQKAADTAVAATENFCLRRWR